MTRIFALISAVVLVAIDQLIKIWALGSLAPVRQIQVIPGFFSLTYIENRGAAFGILQGRIGFLSVVVILVLSAALFAILGGKIKASFLIWSLSLVIAGGAGNLIDRVLRGYVVDYLDFSALFGFPVFNFADCCVVIGTFLILIYILFLDRPQKEGLPQVPSSDESGEI